MKTQVHLNFAGDCDEAITFYEKALGAKRRFMMTWGDSPQANDMPPGWKHKIMHATFTVGDTEVMAADSPPSHFKPMAGFSMSLGVDEPKDAERLFRALSDGATVQMPLEETFWARRFGMLTDRFGTPWMVNCNKPE